jgi:hypothetical protein
MIIHFSIKHAEVAMAFHILIISLQLAAVAAFLILWYFWVKRKLETALILEEENNILFPFRHFAWVFIGVVLLTCLVEVHFLRVSSSAQEKMVSLLQVQKKQDQNAKHFEELRGQLDKLGKDIESSIKDLQARCIVPSAATTTEPRAAQKDNGPLVSMKYEPGFEKEARAANKKPEPLKTDKIKPPEDDQVHSMRLNRTGRVLIESLRVRKTPAIDSPVVDKLTSGQEIKVTEKRLINTSIWFGIITPSGKTGWVDYRYLKLEG